MSPVHLRMLVVSRNLPPLVGGMERLNHHVVLELARRAHLEVVGPPGCGARMPDGVVVCETGSSGLGRFLLRAAWNAFGAALSLPLDITCAGSRLVAPIVLIAPRMR